MMFVQVCFTFCSRCWSRNRTENCVLVLVLCCQRSWMISKAKNSPNLYL